MKMTATGHFEVKLSPQARAEGVGDPTIGRMAIAKTFHGDLQAASNGEMLATRTDLTGSAGYVAMERVTGTLHGRAGSFALQHSGSMNRGTPELAISVVPDSGSGELSGLAGEMAIKVDGGEHSYVFEYILGESG